MPDVTSFAVTVNDPCGSAVRVCELSSVCVNDDGPLTTTAGLTPAGSPLTDTASVPVLGAVAASWQPTTRLETRQTNAAAIRR